MFICFYFAVFSLFFHKKNKLFDGWPCMAAIAQHKTTTAWPYSWFIDVYCGALIERIPPGERGMLGLWLLYLFLLCCCRCPCHCPCFF